MLNNKKQIFGWVMYDWANSAYVTTVLVALLPPYFAAVVVPPEGINIGGAYFTAESIWALMISFSAFVVFIFAPILGAISDFSAAKKRFLMLFCYGGSLATVALVFSSSGDILQTMILFVIAQICFVGSNIFYDAFLPQIASDDQIDWVSGKGFAFGYVGGGLQLALSLGLVTGHSVIGISQELAVRLAIAMAGLWWGGFAIITFLNVQEEPPVESLPAAYQHLPKWRAYTEVGIIRILVTLRKVKQFKHLLLFLIAYLLYNNGIQTVMAMATIYGQQEIGLGTTTLMVTLLFIQFVSVFGALGFSKLAERVTAKKALMLSLVGWCLVIVYAYFLTNATEYFILGGIVGLVQGGSQALSRSFYGAMVPIHASAEFYGFYSVFTKGSAILGPLTFAAIGLITGSNRLAILGVIVFFISGLILLACVDVDRAKDARNSVEFSQH